MADISYGTKATFCTGSINGLYSGIATTFNNKCIILNIDLDMGDRIQFRIGKVDDSGDITFGGTSTPISNIGVGLGADLCYLYDEYVTVFYQDDDQGDEGFVYTTYDSPEYSEIGAGFLPGITYNFESSDTEINAICGLHEIKEGKILCVYRNETQSDALWAWCGRGNKNYTGDKEEISSDVPSHTACCVMESSSYAPIALILYVTSGTVKALGMHCGSMYSDYELTPSTITTIGSISGTGVSCAHLSHGKSIAICGNSAFIVTTSGTSTLSFGNSVDISDVGDCENVHVAAVNHEYFVVVFEDAGDSNKGKSRLCRVSGTDIVRIGDAETFADHAIAYPKVAVMNDYNYYKICVAYCDDADANDIGEAVGGIVNIDRDIKWAYPSEMNGSSVVVNSGQYAEDQIDVCSAGPDRFVGLIRDEDDSNAGKVTVCELSGSSIDWGALDEFCAGVGAQAICHLPGTDKIFVAYEDTGNGNDGYCIIGEIQSDQSVNWGSPVEFYNADVTNIRVCALTATTVAILFNDVSDTSEQLIICTISGTVPTAGSETEVYSSSATWSEIVKVSSDRILVGYTTSTNFYAKLYSISGTTPTLLDYDYHSAMDINGEAFDMCCLEDFKVAVSLGGYVGTGASFSSGSGMFILDLSSDSISIPDQDDWFFLHDHGYISGDTRAVRMEAFGPNAFFVALLIDIHVRYPIGFVCYVDGTTITKRSEEKVFPRLDWTPNAASSNSKDFVYEPCVCVVNERKVILFYTINSNYHDEQAYASVGYCEALQKQKMIFMNAGL